MATRYPRANVSKGSILNQGTFVSVTFGHLPLNLVTFGHLFRGLFEYIYHQTNHRIINFYDSQREYTIANDTITPARGTRKARLHGLAFSIVMGVLERVNDDSAGYPVSGHNPGWSRWIPCPGEAS